MRFCGGCRRVGKTKVPARVPDYVELLPDGRARCRVCGVERKAVSGVQLHHHQAHKAPAERAAGHVHRWRVLRASGTEAIAAGRGYAVICADPHCREVE